MLCHSTTLDKLFQIWQAQAVEPQVFEGSDQSLCPKGRKVIFAYRCQNGKVRKLSEDDDVVIEIVGQAYFTEGVMGLGEDYEVPEYYIHHSIPLDECRVYIEESCIKRVSQIVESSGQSELQECGIRTECEPQRFLLWLLRKTHVINPLYQYQRLRPHGLRKKF
jgi:hypothetical protein